MLRDLCLISAVALATVPAIASAQTAPYADPAAIDAEVAAFTGAAVGMPGGARGPVDRRLRMAPCGQPLAFAWHGRGASMVRVECNAPAAPWRIFVPVNAGGTPATGAAASNSPLPADVARGQVLTITLQGRGFAISQQAEALEEGRVGQWIRVRPEGSREEVRARVDSPVRVTIPLS